MRHARRKTRSLPARVPATLTIWTETDRTMAIRGRLIGPDNRELAVCDGTERGEVIRRLTVSATWSALAHDWEPELVDAGEM